MDSRTAHKAKRIDIAQGIREVLLNKEHAEELGLRANERVKVVNKKGEGLVALVNVTETLVKMGEVGVYVDLWNSLNLKDGDAVHVVPTSRPASIDLIRKKIHGNIWHQEEIKAIVDDICRGNLSDIELAAYVTAVQINDLTMDETTWLTMAMVSTGDTIDWETSPILDVHSIGGVPGNKYAPITVSIVAANGLTIPKTSSRAISSAAGTADIMEVVCNVKHDAQSIKRIAGEVGGTLVWGGGVTLAPVDDSIIRVEYPLSLDPRGQVLASVMSKKKAIGAEYCVIDIPIGEGTKVVTPEEARNLARDFIMLGERIGVRTRCAITYGGQPVGKAVGPILEIREALRVLEGAESPSSLIEKSTSLAGILLELGGRALPDRGADLAKETLRSGKALEKFREIVGAQGGDANVSSRDLVPGEHSCEFPSPRDGYIEAPRNRALIKIARAAGSPRDKGAGLILRYKKGERVEEGEPLITIYAENKRKLEDARVLAGKLQPVLVEGMILGEVVE